MPDHPAYRKDIVVNGRFLAQRMSGVQRYARELVTALDSLIAADPGGLGTRRWRLALPAEAETLPLQAIVTEHVGQRRGHAWEQIDLWRAASTARLVSLGNSGPILHRDAIVVIHDAAPYRTPKNFGAKYGMFHRGLGRLLARTSQIGTVSDFSRTELSQVLRIPASSLFVANNGCDHLINRPRDSTIVPRLGLTPERYFLFVGSPTPNKNLPIALEAFRRLNKPDVRFVVAGSLNKAVFGGESPETMPGVIVASGLPDAAIAGLYANAAALVFPSRYEGFGIPPIEAMTCGCPVIASDIPVVREVCEDAATYFDPDDIEGLVALMERHLDAPAEAESRRVAAAGRVAHFTWERAARSLVAAILPG
jgi:glycosyltransferase involved in cell wall biosynthesis